jgi:hypothetical protein
MDYDVWELEKVPGPGSGAGRGGHVSGAGDDNAAERPAPVPRFFEGDGSVAQLGAPRDREVAVGLFERGGQPVALLVDADGALRLVEGGDGWGAHHNAAARALNAGEVAGNALELLTPHTWAFGLHYASARPDVAGLDDPIELHGTLFGPFPGGPGDPPRARGGVLTCTRGEVLDAVVRGSWKPFSASVDSDHGDVITLVFGAGSTADLALGNGVVLALPFEPDAVDVTGPGNDGPVRRLLRDVLDALKTDAASEGHEELASREIPHATRADVVSQLVMAGFEIAGDVAVRRSGGLLRRLFPERVKLAEPGTTQQFLALAALALDDLPRWPSERALALRRCTRTREVSWRVGDARGLTPVVRSTLSRFSVDGSDLVSEPSKDRPASSSDKDRRYASQRAIYLQIDETLRDHAGPRLELEIEVFDDQLPGAVWVGYTATDGERRYTERTSLSGAGSYRRLRFPIPDAQLSRPMTKHDVQLGVWLEGFKDVRVRSAWLRDLTPRLSPPGSSGLPS